MIIVGEFAESLRSIRGHLLACAAVGVASIAGAAGPIVAAAPATQTVGEIHGTVTDASTGTPLDYIVMCLLDAQGHFMPRTLAASGLDGRYAILPPAAGAYFVYTYNPGAYLPEIHDDLQCYPSAYPSTCDLGEATMVEVMDDGVAVEGIDFELVRGGVICGEITGEGSAGPIDALVDLFDSEGRSLAVSWTNSGSPWSEYCTHPGVPTGSYFVTTYNTFEFDGGMYVDEAWEDMPCMDPYELGACDPTSATPVGVVAGSTTYGIDFELRRGGYISGHVTSVAGGAALGGVKAEVFTAAGYRVSEGHSLTDGSWQSDWSLPTGGYYIRFSRFGYQPVLYPGIASDLTQPCAPCDVFDGTLVTATYGGTTEGIDVALVPVDWLFGSGFEGGGLGDWDSASP